MNDLRPFKWPNPGKLNGLRCYLSGPMDYAEDRGIGWRRTITPFLEDSLGVHVIDPTDEFVLEGKKEIENDIFNSREAYEKSREEKSPDDPLTAKEKDWIIIASNNAKRLRSFDLRMTDVADFSIVFVNVGIYTCGTWEEVANMNRQKKPILIFTNSDRYEVPTWLLGMLPNEYFFPDMGHIEEYLSSIHHSEEGIKDKRWVFLNVANYS